MISPMIVKITFVATVLLFGGASAQVIISDAVGTAPTAQKTSVLLEFANTNNKGIILPYVRTKAATPTEGSIVLDASAPGDARVKYYNGSWVDLSGQGADISTLLSTQPTESQVPETAVAKSIIGAATTAVNDGVLVLESGNKAMVLPQAFWTELKQKGIVNKAAPTPV